MHNFITINDVPHITYDDAKLLVQLEYPIHNDKDRYIYGSDGNKLYFLSSIGAYDFKGNPVNKYERPLDNYPVESLDTVRKWILEKHHIHIEIVYRIESNFGYRIKKCTLLDDSEIDSNVMYESYEDALSCGIHYVLEYLNSMYYDK